MCDGGVSVDDPSVKVMGDFMPETDVLHLRIVKRVPLTATPAQDEIIDLTGDDDEEEDDVEMQPTLPTSGAKRVVEDDEAEDAAEYDSPPMKRVKH